MDGSPDTLTLSCLHVFAAVVAALLLFSVQLVIFRFIWVFHSYFAPSCFFHPAPGFSFKFLLVSADPSVVFQCRCGLQTLCLRLERSSLGLRSCAAPARVVCWCPLLLGPPLPPAALSPARQPAQCSLQAHPFLLWVFISFIGLTVSDMLRLESFTFPYFSFWEWGLSWVCTPAFCGVSVGPRLGRLPAEGHHICAVPSQVSQCQPSSYVLNSENCGTEQFVHIADSTRKGQTSCPFAACPHPNWWHIYEFQVYVNRTGEALC